MHIAKNKISSALTRYNFVVKILGQIIDKVETKNQGENRWFIYSEKIARKYLNQAYTLQQIFKDDIYLIKDGKESRFIDFSSIFTLLRAQLETHSVFYHLFADKCEKQEKILRFRLWELDGLRTIDNYERPELDDISDRLDKNKKDIDNCIAKIDGISYFKNLDIKKQTSLLKYANWKFSTDSLKNKDERKWKLSINKMIMNTGLKGRLFNDWYSFTSTHVHTSYWSVVQNDSLTTEEKTTMEYVAIMQGDFITSFLIKDLCKIYETARKVFESLPKKEQDVLNSFDNSGRE